MKIDVLTLFPEMFDGVINSSILGRAAKNKIIDIRIHNIRDYTVDKHKKTDDYPYGGGAGMVMTPQPVFSAMEAVKADEAKVIYLSPKGSVFDQAMAERYTKCDRIVLLCGHYEGIDQRIIDRWVDAEVSIGDYILTGGELPAMVLIDSIARLLPGVLGCADSSCDESFSDGLLEYPHYTRPAVYEDMAVPEVLLSGNHAVINKWRNDKAVELTRERRPDIMKNNKTIGMK